MSQRQVPPGCARLGDTSVLTVGDDLIAIGRQVQTIVQVLVQSSVACRSLVDQTPCIEDGQLAREGDLLDRLGEPARPLGIPVRLARRMTIREIRITGVRIDGGRGDQEELGPRGIVRGVGPAQQVEDGVQVCLELLDRELQDAFEEFASVVFRSTRELRMAAVQIGDSEGPRRRSRRTRRRRGRPRVNAHPSEQGTVGDEELQSSPSARQQSTLGTDLAKDLQTHFGCPKAALARSLVKQDDTASPLLYPVGHHRSRNVS